MHTFDALFMTLLLLVSLYFFYRIMRTKILVLLRAKPEVRWDRVQDRIENVIRIAFAQKKLFKEKAAGVMHAFIFWGFLILLFRSLTLICRAYSEGGVFESAFSIFWFSKGLDHAYTWLKDITEIVVLIMVAYAAFRRLVIKPARLTITPSGYLILGLIATLMVTDYLYDGARIASNLPHIAEEARYSPVSSIVAQMFGGMSLGAFEALGTTMFWIHIATLLFFLNELPRSKHFHVITSIPNVFFAKIEPKGALRPILDIENQETFGVSKPQELTWKQIFDGYSCTECGRCTVNCPAHLTKKPLNPKELIRSVRDYVKKYEKEIIEGKDVVAEGAPTIVDAIGEEVIWSCTTCRSCEENCPVTIEHVDKIVDFRRYLTLMEGRMSKELTTTMKNLENKGNPWGLASSDRGGFVKELGVQTLAEKGSAEYLYFLGCFASYDDRNQKVARSVIRLLQKAGVDFAVLGGEEQCCGDPARRLGNEYLFQMQAQANIETMKAYGVKKIITSCPHCMNTLMNEYPQFGGKFEVVHHSVFLLKLVKDGKVRLKAPEEVATKVVYHDSCYLGRYNDIYDEPRALLEFCKDIEVKDIKRSRENGMCCGAGGGLMFKEEHHERVNRLRLSQLEESGCSLIATACPFCLVMLKDAVAETKKEDKLRVFDIAEFLEKKTVS